MLFSAPLEIFWCVTNRCNLSCVFCMCDSGSAAREEPTAEQRQRIVQEIIRARVLNLYLTGGEPLLVPELPDYIRQLRAGNVHVTVTTNGTLLTEEKVCRLTEAGTNHIQVSINGASAETNDLLMGPSFHRIVEGITALNRAGLAPRIKVTVTRKNIDDMPELIRFLAGYETERISLFEVSPIGRGFYNYEDLKPAEEDLRRLEEWTETHQEIYPQMAHFKSFTLALLKEGRASTCSLGDPNINSCQIMHNGQVVQCSYAMALPERNNLFRYGLVGAWQRLPRFEKYLAPERLEGKCGVCESKRVCKGGCRALAYLQGRGEWAEDPICPHLPVLQEV